MFVARLLGPTNLLQGQIDGNGSESRREVVVRTPLGRLVAKATGSGSTLAQGTPVTISIRPETLSLGPSIPADWNRFPATIERILFRGAIRQVDLRGPGDWPITARVLQNQSPGLREGQGATVRFPGVRDLATRRSRGLSCMKGNFHVQFLGEGVAATSPPYPTLGWVTTQVYPARGLLGLASKGPVAAMSPRPPAAERRNPAGVEYAFRLLVVSARLMVAVKTPSRGRTA